MYKTGDIIKLKETTLKVIMVYRTNNKELFYKNRMVLVNLKTGDVISCANN